MSRARTTSPFYHFCPNPSLPFLFVEKSKTSAYMNYSALLISPSTTSPPVSSSTPTQQQGISIPYPTITLHALSISPPSVFLQLLKSDPATTFDDHDEESSVSLRLVPPGQGSPSADSLPQSASLQDPQPSNDIATEAKKIYDALSSCADLHPDPASPSQEDGALQFPDIDGGDGSITMLNGENGSRNCLPPPMPGSGGWITADNIQDYMDEERNFRVEGLGGGAGTVRAREDDEEMGVDEDGGQGTGDEGGEGGGEGAETKWRRTS